MISCSVLHKSSTHYTLQLKNGASAKRVFASIACIMHLGVRLYLSHQGVRIHPIKRLLAEQMFESPNFPHVMFAPIS